MGDRYKIKNWTAMRDRAPFVLNKYATYSLVFQFKFEVVWQ